MTRASRSAGRAAAMMLAVLLAGCGQRGPLFLPSTPPEVEPVAAPAAGRPDADENDAEPNER
jgi:predicted small lipoprotein YifL